MNAGRGIVKRTAAVAVVALALAPCAPLLADEEGPAAGHLAIYHWFDYMPQELLAKFSAETGIEVTMDVYESNAELLATLRAGGLGLYDGRSPATTWCASWPTRECWTRSRRAS